MPTQILTSISGKVALQTRKELKIIVGQVGTYVESKARLKAPRKTGALQSAIQRGPVQQDAKYTWVDVYVADNALPYGAYQERGTGIYRPGGDYIRPKRAKFLAWVSVGKQYQGRNIVRSTLIASGIRKRLNQYGPDAAKNRYLHFATKVKGTPPVRYMQRAATEASTQNNFTLRLQGVGAVIEKYLIAVRGE